MTEEGRAGFTMDRATARDRVAEVAELIEEHDPKKHGNIILSLLDASAMRWLLAEEKTLAKQKESEGELQSPPPQAAEGL